MEFITTDSEGLAAILKKIFGPKLAEKDDSLISTVLQAADEQFEDGSFVSFWGSMSDDEKQDWALTTAHEFSQLVIAAGALLGQIDHGPEDPIFKAKYLDREVFNLVRIVRDEFTDGGLYDNGGQDDAGAGDHSSDGGSSESGGEPGGDNDGVGSGFAGGTVGDFPANVSVFLGGELGTVSGPAVWDEHTGRLVSVDGIDLDSYFHSISPADLGGGPLPDGEQVTASDPSESQPLV